MNFLIALVLTMSLNPAYADSCKQVCYDYRNGNCVDMRTIQVPDYRNSDGWYQCSGQSAQLHVQIEPSRRRAYNRGSTPRVRGGLHLQVGPTYVPPPPDMYSDPYDQYYSLYDQYHDPYGAYLPPMLTRDLQIIDSEASIISTQMWADGRSTEVQGAQQLQAAAEAEAAELEATTQRQASQIEALKLQREKAQKEADAQQARADSAEEVLTDILEGE
ncbi:hypothetical protein HN358_02870 [Candidatus Uhrbacteria bacterium]|nr:hypothetical protein [Candidatus Uhrbacteria bacterium]MBT7717143.1 hypothetical protein [Candidatus Uhrbacteria bacterium]